MTIKKNIFKIQVLIQILVLQNNEEKWIVIKTNLLKVPSMALIPIPSTISLVNRNGTVSGVANTLPFSKAMPNEKINNKNEK